MLCTMPLSVPEHSAALPGCSASPPVHLCSPPALESFEPAAMAVVARALRLLQLASQPWLRFLAAAAALGWCWGQASPACGLLLFACMSGAPFHAYELLQEIAGELGGGPGLTAALPGR